MLLQDMLNSNYFFLSHVRKSSGGRFQCCLNMDNFQTSIFILLFLSCWGAVGAEYPKYKDPKQPLNVRINDLLGRMTLAEKIGQMSQIERKNASADVIEGYFIGKIQSNLCVNSLIVTCTEMKRMFKLVQVVF